jgi:hypothetical protein
MLPIRDILKVLLDFLRSNDAGAAADRMATAIAGTDEQLATYIMSDELWGGAGSIADEMFIDNHKARSDLEAILAELGRVQIEAGIVNVRTHMWVAAFRERHKHKTRDRTDSYAARIAAMHAWPHAPAKMPTENLLKERALGFDIPEYYISWAIERLCEGADSEGLRILAGLDPVRERNEIEPCFLRAAAELEIELPAAAEPAMKEACRIRQLYDWGHISAQEAIRSMFWLCVEADYDDRYMLVWFYITEEDGRGYYYPSQLHEDLDATFIHEWNLYRRAVLIGPPADFMDYVCCNRCGHAAKPEPAEPPTCSQCGSTDCPGMIDPFVRDRYLRSLESEHGP